jgi:hypothetical protein
VSIHFVSLPQRCVPNNFGTQYSSCHNTCHILRTISVVLDGEMVGRRGNVEVVLVSLFLCRCCRYDEPGPVPDFLNIPRVIDKRSETSRSSSANGQVQSRPVNAQPLPVRTIRDTRGTAYTIVLSTCAGLSIYSTQKFSIYHGRHLFGRNALA